MKKNRPCPFAQLRFRNYISFSSFLGLFSARLNGFFFYLLCANSLSTYVPVHAEATSHTYTHRPSEPERAFNLMGPRRYIIV